MAKAVKGKAEKAKAAKPKTTAKSKSKCKK